MATMLILAGCSSGQHHRQNPPTGQLLTVRGSIVDTLSAGAERSDGVPCSTSRYHGQDQVVVRDDQGRTLGTGTLDAGRTAGDECVFAFAAWVEPSSRITLAVAGQTVGPVDAARPIELAVQGNRLTTA